MASTSRGSAARMAKAACGGHASRHAPIVSPAPAPPAARRDALCPTDARDGSCRRAYHAAPPGDAAASSTARGLRHHLLDWGEPALDSRRAAAARDAARLDGRRRVVPVRRRRASPTDRHVLALDWRGFGADRHAGRPTPTSSPTTSATSSSCSTRCSAPARAPIDLLGHSMGGNVAMLYAGVRPAARPPAGQPRRLRHAALEAGAGARAAMRQVARRAEEAEQLRPYAERRGGRRAPARRPTRCCAPTAPPGSRATGRGPTGDGDGRLAPPRRPEPQARRARCSPSVDEWLEFWKRITAPVLWVEGDRTDIGIWWGDRYTKAEFHERLNVVADVERHVVGPAGHMLHHDRPEDIARLLEAFLSESRPCPATIAPLEQRPTMDVEHINAIGNQLADLTPAHRSTFGGIFDYDRKALRLNEVNAALENPNVWNEPKRAQELGREKRTLETVVDDHRPPDARTSPTTPSSTRCRRPTTTSTACSAIEADAGQARGDDRRARVPPHVQQPGRPEQLLPRHPGRRRRHRGLRLGGRCCCAST